MAQGTSFGKLDPNQPTVIGGITSNGVHRSGKWAELNYKPSKYPKFPIGSVGHILSRSAAKWITDNAGTLFNYQGEDVSIGIWFDESPLKGTVNFVDGRQVMTNSGNCNDASKYIIGHDLTEHRIRACWNGRDETFPHG